MTSEEVLDFFSTLKLTRLRQTREMWVYNAQPNGVIGAKVLKIKAGTPVFVDVTGAPVLWAKCGNPFVNGPKQPFSVPPEIQPLKTEHVPKPLVPEKVFESVKSEVITEVLQPETPPPFPPEVTLPVGELAPTVVHGGTHAQFGVIAPSQITALPALFLVFLAPHSGGHTIVPEPATILAFGIGVIALMSAGKRRLGGSR